MKKKMIYGMSVVACLLASCMYVACEDIDEVPPREEGALSSQTYKIPEPVVLNASEADVVNAIKREYDENVTQ